MRFINRKAAFKVEQITYSFVLNKKPTDFKHILRLNTNPNTLIGISTDQTVEKLTPSTPASSNLRGRPPNRIVPHLTSPGSYEEQLKKLAGWRTDNTWQASRKVSNCTPFSTSQVSRDINMVNQRLKRRSLSEAVAQRSSPSQAEASSRSLGDGGVALDSESLPSEGGRPSTCNPRSLLFRIPQF